MKKQTPIFAPRPCLDSGFTLIELLTVIAIIGILAAIIIPTVGVVRGKARATQCVSNLRQIGMAMNLFADENKDRFPIPAGDTSHPEIQRTGSWMQQLAPYVGLENVLGSHPQPRASGVFNCPDFISSTNPSDANFRKVAYAYHDFISTSVWNPSGKAWDYLRSSPPAPSQYFLLVEIQDNMDTIKPSTYTLPFRHPGRSGNFLFADGHVASVRAPVAADDPRWHW